MHFRDFLFFARDFLFSLLHLNFLHMGSAVSEYWGLMGK